jgi:nicotinamidase-related amidase
VSRQALVVVDVLNRYEHEDAGELMDSVRQTVSATAEVIATARRNGTPTIFVNDNYGEWSAGRAELCERALQGPDASLIEPVLPPEDCAFLVKARHSAFYATQLDDILRERCVDEVVLVGQVTEQCILYSALDAYVRRYSVIVPRDAVAHIHADLAEAALRMMELNMGAQIVSAGGLPAG